MSGSNANRTGKDFENLVQHQLEQVFENLNVVDYKDVCTERSLTSKLRSKRRTMSVQEVKQKYRGQPLLIKNMPRERANQNQKRAFLEFYLCETDTYIECKFQEVTGTAYQKIVHAMKDSRFNSVDGSNTLFVLGGSKLTTGLYEPYWVDECSLSPLISFVYNDGTPNWTRALTECA